MLHEQHENTGRQYSSHFCVGILRFAYTYHGAVEQKAVKDVEQGQRDTAPRTQLTISASGLRGSVTSILITRHGTGVVVLLG